MSFLCFRIRHTRNNSAIIAITATPAPVPMLASAPGERPGELGCTRYWMAKTTFTIADVGFWVVIEDLSVALVVSFPLAVFSRDIGEWLATGIAGGTR